MNVWLDHLRSKGWTPADAMVALTEVQRFGFVHFDADPERQAAYRRGRDAFLQAIENIEPEKHHYRPQQLAKNLRKAWFEGALGQNIPDLRDSVLAFHDRFMAPSEGGKTKKLPAWMNTDGAKLMEIIQLSNDLDFSDFQTGRDAKDIHAGFLVAQGKKGDGWDRLDAIAREQRNSLIDFTDGQTWGAREATAAEAAHERLAPRPSDAAYPNLRKLLNSISRVTSYKDVSELMTRHIHFIVTNDDVVCILNHHNDYVRQWILSQTNIPLTKSNIADALNDPNFGVRRAVIMRPDIKLTDVQIKDIITFEAPLNVLALSGRDDIAFTDEHIESGLLRGMAHLGINDAFRRRRDEFDRKALQDGVNDGTAKRERRAP